jgi:hypothetical protein
MTRELTPDTVSRVLWDTTLGQPMYRAYALLGLHLCPECGERMNASGLADNGDHLRSLWRCVTRTCPDYDSVFALTTHK